MPRSAVLEVALGLSFLFATLSLVASGANEILAVVLALRARTLEKGVANLLADSDTTRALYQHPLIRSLYRGKRRPSYIPKEKFSLAFVDLQVRPAVDAVGDATASVTAAIADLPEGRVRDSLDVLWRDARGDVGEFRRNVEGWFDDSMERVSGWYRRLAQAILFGLGVTLAVGVGRERGHRRPAALERRPAAGRCRRHGHAGRPPARRPSPRSSAIPVPQEKPSESEAYSLGSGIVSEYGTAGPFRILRGLPTLVCGVDRATYGRRRPCWSMCPKILLSWQWTSTRTPSSPPCSRRSRRRR